MIVSHQQRQRAVLVQLVGVMRRDGFDLCSLRFCHGDYDNAARGALQRGLHIGERLRCDLPHEQHGHLIPPKSHLKVVTWDFRRMRGHAAARTSAHSPAGKVSQWDYARNGSCGIAWRTI